MTTSLQAAGVREDDGEPSMPAPRTALVTGGSRGIGRAVALRLAQDGFDVVVGYATRAEDADKVVSRIEELGRRAVAVAVDVGDDEAVDRAFDLAESFHGGVDVVVNSAGRASFSPVADIDLAVLDEIHRTNIRGTFIVARQAARRLREGGTIVTFSTSQVSMAFPAYGVYIASKAAVEALTLVLAREMRGRGITVNSVAPGPTATDLFFEGKDDETVARLAAAPPLERLGTAGDIAEVVSFLAGPSGHWVNGQVVRANGGIA